MHMSHSPYEPTQGVGRGVDPDPTNVYEVGTEVAPGTGAVYEETYVVPAEDLYAPQSTGTSASDVKDTAADQGRRVAGTAKESAAQVKDTAADQGRRVADTAKEQAGQVKDTAVEQGQKVAAVAKDEAAQVKDEAVSSLKDIVGQGRTELTSQIGTSQNRLAEYVHSLSDELGTMASGGGDGTGPLADLAHRYARQGGEISHWLSEHEPADLLDEVTRFARRRPWTFLGASMLAGVVVGRVTRSLAAEKKDEHDAQQLTSSTSTPALSGADYSASVGQAGTTGYATTGYESTGYASTGYESTTPATGYTSGYVAGDLPENPAPQTWTGGSR
jgi:gas vesicle protein